MKKTFLSLAMALACLGSQAQVFRPDGVSSPACGITYWWPCSYNQGFSANWDPNPAVAISYYINTSTGSVADVTGESGGSQLHFEVGNYIPNGSSDQDAFYFKKDSKTGAVIVYKTLDLGIYSGLGSNSDDKVSKTTYDQATKLLYMCGRTKASGSPVSQPFLLCYDTQTDNVVWMTLLPSTYSPTVADADANDVMLYNGDIYVAMTNIDPSGIANVHEVVKCNAGGAVLASGASPVYGSTAGSTFTPYQQYTKCMTIHPSSHSIIVAGSFFTGFGWGGSIMQFDLNTLAYSTWGSSGNAIEDVDVDPTTDEIVTFGNANTFSSPSMPGNYAYWSNFTATPFLTGPNTWGYSTANDEGKNMIISPQGDYIVTCNKGGYDYLTYIDKKTNQIHYGSNAYQFPLYSYAQALHKDDDGKVLVGGIDKGQGGGGQGDDAKVFTAKFNSKLPPWTQYQNRLSPTKVNAPIAVVPFSIFPNPATDLITISHEAGQGVCEVRNVTGQLVLSATPAKEETQTQLRVAGLAPGMYQVSYKVDGARALTGKFVKQ